MTTHATKDQVHIRLPADLHRQAKQAAQDDDRSVNYIVVKALRLYLSDLGYS